MKGRFSLVGVVLLKDLRLFGSFALLVAALLVIQQFPQVVAQLGFVGAFLQVGVQLGVVLLVLVVCQEDAIVSLRHDWLTRPVPGEVLLLAKILFVVLVAIVPIVLGAFVYNLTQRASLAEASLAAVSSGASADVLTTLALIMAFAAVTANARQAVVVFLAGVVALVIVLRVWVSLSQFPEPPASTSSGWMLMQGMQLLLISGSAAILWVQYRYRHTTAARGIAAVAVIGSVALASFVTWTPVFTIQKMLSPDPGAARMVDAGVAAGCFPTRVLDAGPGTATGAASFPTAQRYSEEHRKSAGPGAIAFSTQLQGRSLPAGGVLTVDHVSLAYFNAGQEQQVLRPGRTSSHWVTGAGKRAAADHYWLLPEADARRLAAMPAVETRLHYSLSLLAPKHVVRIAVDGRRGYYPGIGWCSARLDRALSRISIDCFKPGVQPAMLLASLEGAADDAVASRQADFTPALLQLWRGRRHNMQLVATGASMPGVVLTAYEARAHFDRQIVVPGVLGGPDSACPIPSHT